MPAGKATALEATEQSQLHPRPQAQTDPGAWAKAGGPLTLPPAVCARRGSAGLLPAQDDITKAYLNTCVSFSYYRAFKI